MNRFSRSLNILLEDGYSVDSVSTAMDLAHELEAAKQHVSDLQHQLDSICAKLNSELAMMIRRLKPSLNVSVHKGLCKIGYKSKFLIFKPNMDKGMWVAHSDDYKFLRAFNRNYIRSLMVTNNIHTIATSIIDFFTNYYKSLGEDIIGTGKILIEDKSSSLLELADWNSRFSL